MNKFDYIVNAKRKNMIKSNRRVKQNLDECLELTIINSDVLRIQQRTINLLLDGIISITDMLPISNENNK